MMKMGLINIIFRRNKFEKPAKITWENIKKFFQGNYFKVKRSISTIEDVREEQYKWRLSLIQKTSPLCIEQGNCRICGCNVDGLALSDPPCEGNCFPEIMNATQWHQYKKINNIKI